MCLFVLIAPFSFIIICYHCQGLWHSSDQYEVEPVPSCVISHLSQVHLYRYEGEGRQNHLAKFFMANGKELKKLVVSVHSQMAESQKDEILNKLSTFPKASSCLEFVIIRHYW